MDTCHLGEMPSLIVPSGYSVASQCQYQQQFLFGVDEKHDLSWRPFLTLENIRKPHLPYTTTKAPQKASVPHNDKQERTT